MARFCTLLGTFVILFAGACISPAEVDFAEAEQELVVYSHFGVDEPMKIYLTHTRDPLQPNQAFEAIEDARINVYRDGELVSYFNRGVPDKKVEYLALYDTEVTAIGGSSYQIEVMAEGYKNARSVETVPHHRANISNFIFIENTDEGKLYRLRFLDDENVKNYYQLIVKELIRDMRDSIISEEVVEYELARSSAFPHFENDTRTWAAIYPEYAGFLFTGVRGESGFKELFIDIPDKERTSTNETHSYRYRVELHNVSEAYFLYHQSVHAQLTDNNPLNEPIHIFNNIEGGFGNFSAYNAITDEADALRVGE